MHDGNMSKTVNRRNINQLVMNRSCSIFNRFHMSTKQVSKHLQQTLESLEWHTSQITKSQHASKQIPKISYLKQRHTKTINPETKFQHKIKIGNILYPEFGNELLNTWNESPKKIEWGLGIWNDSSKAPILHVWGLGIWAPAMEIRNKLFQEISLNKIT